MGDYNYGAFSPAGYDLDTFTGPAPGEKAPDFQVTDADGAPRRLLDFDTRFLVLETGSITCPLFQGRRSGMERLRARSGDTTFRVLYVREAHPGAAIPAHRTPEDKRDCARRLIDEDGEQRDIVIDAPDGPVHRAYGSYPNAVFIINRAHCVLWFSDWNAPGATERALAALRRGEAAANRSLFRPVPPWVAWRTLRRSGGGALADFLAGLPRLIWKNLIRRNLRVLAGSPVPVKPDTTC